MPNRSAGLLMYRRSKEDLRDLEVFLIHPGGPFWAKKDKGAWAIPKGEHGEDEEPVAAARREFEEETGFVPGEALIALGSIRQKSGKVVTAWAFEGDCDASSLVSNTCMVEWPPHSGRSVEIPEVDQGRWFSVGAAREYLRPEQTALLDRLEVALGLSTDTATILKEARLR